MPDCQTSEMSQLAKGIGDFMTVLALLEQQAGGVALSATAFDVQHVKRV